MTNDYEEYEKECKLILQENEKLLEEFAAWLSAQGLSDSTVQRHCDNMDFYLNDFLLYDDAIDASSGIFRAGMYLGYWFIRKAMWANQSTIKSNAASLKKFYTFMLEKGEIDEDDLDELKAEIKEGMPEWLDTMARYDNPDVDYDDIWDY